MVTLTLPLGYIFLPRKVNNYLGTVHRSLSTSPPLQVAKSFRAFVFIIKKKCTVPHPFHVRLFQDSADMSLVLYFFFGFATRDYTFKSVLSFSNRLSRSSSSLCDILFFPRQLYSNSSFIIFPFNILFCHQQYHLSPDALFFFFESDKLTKEQKRKIPIHYIRSILKYFYCTVSHGAEESSLFYVASKPQVILERYTS